MPADAETLAFYAAEAACYAEAEDRAPRPHLESFISKLAPGSRVLELGCGGGHDAAAMLRAGLNVDPTDGVGCPLGECCIAARS